MDGIRIKKELDDGEITIEYNDVITDQRLPLKTSKLEAEVSNKINGIQPKDKELVVHKSPNVEPKVSNNKIINIQSEDKQAALKTTCIPPTSIITSSLKITKVDSKKPLLKTIERNKSNISVGCSNVKISGDSRNESSKSTLKACPNIPHDDMPSSNYTQPIHSVPFQGATFLHTQVHSNPVLQSLLKDIVSLNNEKDNVDEDAINHEIATLRSKNNLPSFNAEVPIDLEYGDSDYSESSEDESCSYYDSKDSENYGKDSGYDNESQYSGSLEDDNKSEIQENLGNETEKPLVIAEPEYIDLDNYYGNNSKRKLACFKGSLADIRGISKKSQPAVPNKSTPSLNQSNKLTCPECNKTLKSKRTYRHHIQNGTGCLKKRLPQNNPKQSNTDEILTTTEGKQVTLAENGLFKCIGKCKFIGTKKDLRKHVQKEHLNIRKSAVKDKTVVPLTCKECYVTFKNNSGLEQHYRSYHKEKMSCLFCDFVCDYLTEYNLHISSKHSKKGKTEKSLGSDEIEIIEIDVDK